MVLTKKQKGVMKRMLLGMSIALLIVILGAWLNPFSFDNLSEIERLVITIQWLLLPGLFLMASVGRLAKHRFFTPEDIDGSALSEGTQRGKVLQSLLQNTLEQFVIISIICLTWAVTMPAVWMSVIPLVAMTFAVGRTAFFMMYTHGSSARALGFTLSFYPAMVMLLGMVGKMIGQYLP